MHMCKVHIIKYYLVIKLNGNRDHCVDLPWIQLDHMRNTWLTDCGSPHSNKHLMSFIFFSSVVWLHTYNSTVYVNNLKAANFVWFLNRESSWFLIHWIIKDVMFQKKIDYVITYNFALQQCCSKDLVLKVELL